MPSDKLFQLVILTPAKLVFSGKVRSVIFPAEKGFMGVMSHHAPFVGLVKPGPVLARVWEKDEEHKKIFFVSHGLAKVVSNTLTLLVDSAEAEDQIDEERARRALERALKRLASRDPDVDRERAMRAKLRALARLQIAQKKVFPD
ncbi:MAG: ATP synthase F1 subunit epsilon [bacterium JZ-2024 1]